MRVVKIVGGFAMALLVGLNLNTALAQDAADAPYTIKEVMVQGHKDGLRKKIVAGEASQEEKLKLLDLYMSMLESKPPKGDDRSWQELAGRATLAAGKVAVGRDGSIDELKQATKCATCHKAHKGK